MTAVLNGGTSTLTKGIFMRSLGTNTQMNYTINGLTSVTTNASGTADAITVGTAGGTNVTETGAITNNTITNGSTCFACTGVTINSTAASGLSTIAVTGNTIGGTNYNAVWVNASSGGAALNLTIRRNTVSTTRTSATDGYAMEFDSGGTATSCLFVDLGDMSVGHVAPLNQNTIIGSNWNGTGGTTIWLTTAGGSARMKLSNLSTFTDAGAAAWTAASNVGGGTTAKHNGVNNFGGNPVCP
jgi:hypothetical protein